MEDVERLAELAKGVEKKVNLITALERRLVDTRTDIIGVVQKLTAEQESLETLKKSGEEKPEIGRIYDRGG